MRNYCYHNIYSKYNVSTRESTLIPRATQARTKNTPPQLSKTYNKMVRLIFNGVLKRVRFIFRSQNPKWYDCSTRYDYSASAGNTPQSPPTCKTNKKYDSRDT